MATESTNRIVAEATMNDSSMSAGMEQIRGNLTQLESAFNHAATEVQTTGAKMEEAAGHGAVLHENFNKLKESSEGFREKVSDLGKELSGALVPGVAGVVLGAASFAGTIAEATKAALAFEVVQTRLNTALKDNIPNWGGDTRAINEGIDARKQMGFSDVQLMTSLSALLPFTKDVGQAFNLQSIAMDLARGKSIDLATASSVIGRVFEGHIGILSRYGIAVEKGATATQALAQIQAAYGGQAQAYANSNAGAFDRLKIAWEESTRTLGTALLPTLASLAKEFADILPTLVDAGRTVGEVLAPSFQILGTVLAPVGALLGFVASALASFQPKAEDAGAGIDAFSGKIQNGMLTAQDSVNTGLSNIEGSMSGTATDAAQYGTDTGQGFSDNVATGINTGQDGISSQLDNLGTSLDISSNAAQTGQAVGQAYTGQPGGVADAIESGKQAVDDAAAGVVAVMDKTGDASALGKATAESDVNSIVLAVKAGVASVDEATAMLVNLGMDKRQAAATMGAAVGMAYVNSVAATVNANLQIGAIVPGKKPDGFMITPGDHPVPVFSSTPIGPQRPSYTGSGNFAQDPFMQAGSDSTQMDSGQTNNSDIPPELKKAVEAVKAAKDQRDYIKNVLNPLLKEAGLPEEAVPGDAAEKKAKNAADSAAKKAEAAAKKAAAEAAAAAKKADDQGDTTRQTQEYVANLKAKQAVTAADAALTQEEATLKGQQDALTAALKQNGKDEEAALAEPGRNLKEAQEAQAQEAAYYATKLHDLGGEMKGLQADMKAFDDSSKTALQPFIFAVDIAQNALDSLRASTALADEEFDRMGHALSDQMYQAQQAEDAALKPLQANLDAVNDRLATLRDEQAAISWQYEQKLVPLQKELNELQASDVHQQHIDKLHQEQVSVENLAARMALATGAERAQLAGQLAAAQSQQGRDTKEFSLEERITRINAERDAALQSVNEQIHAAEQQQKAAQAQYDAQKKIFELQKQNIADNQALLEHQRQEYDYEQHQKELADQDDVTKAQNRLTELQNIQKTIHDAKQKGIDDLQEIINKTNENADTIAQRNQNIVNSYQQTFNDIKGAFDSKGADIQQKITDFNDNKDKLLQPFKDAADAAHKMASDLSEAYGIVEHIDTMNDKSVKPTGDLAVALQQAQSTIDKIVPQLPHLSLGMDGVNTSFGTAATNVKGSVKSLLDPTVAGSATSLTLKAFDKTDPNSILGGWNTGWDKAYQHLTDAFEPQAKSSLEGWLQMMGTGVAGPLAKDVGKAMDDGLRDGINANQQEVIDAFTAVVSAAINAAKQAAGISSPSRVAADQLGRPIADGIAMGIHEGIPGINQALALATSGYGSGSSYGSSPLLSGMSTYARSGHEGHTFNSVTVLIQPKQGALTLDEARTSARNIGIALQERGIRRGIA
jgi:hypothetical protein